ncbi:FAD binding domain-containing protein [Colletotrichum karsti]|uniref:FAD binding domain-containing protein n=1 Tax=Colletotrichum karsti TaxID=1095194 RepID=A0A9P6HYG3_9PEZI|nr:FAD binding domain-containing protein [Colletotrichum karsti]KAF9872422.1 FAD binding domain-containing protein [Colletotrichum karsti]
MLKRMMKAGVFAGLAAASNCSSDNNGTLPSPFKGGNPPCDALITAGLKDRVLLPADAAYEAQLNTWWAKNARQHPWCLVLPQSAEEVALVLTTLLDAGNGAGDWHIAVRSGGHGWQLNNNIQNGVTIDLTHMNSSIYDKETNVARVDTGGHWQYVYKDLDDQGVVVVGGRDGNVGVGGFLLGGGTSFFSPARGFGADNVVNYEVVLANGTITNANKSCNADLWRALKGGGSNFGIVTRFDLEALPTRELHYEVRLLPGNATDAVADTLVEFANYDMSMADNALVTYLAYEGSERTAITIGTIYVNTAGEDNVTTAYDSLREIPAVFNSTEKKTLAKSANESQVAGNRWAAGATLLYKSDKEILQHSAKLHEEFVQSLQESIGEESFGTMIFLQPVTKDYGRIGEEKGGNMLGLENMRNNAIMWTAAVFVDTNEADFAVAEQRLNEMAGKLNDFAESVDGAEDLVYLNYASARQDSLGSYGSDNLEYMREVAEKYDPEGVFQTRIPGGFKLSRAG